MNSNLFHKIQDVFQHYFSKQRYNEAVKCLLYLCLLKIKKAVYIKIRSNGKWGKMGY